MTTQNNNNGLEGCHLQCKLSSVQSGIIFVVIRLSFVKWSSCVFFHFFYHLYNSIHYSIQIFLYFMFPNFHDKPTFLEIISGHFPISFPVPFKFFLPEVDIAFWDFSMFRTIMPKTRIDEYDRFIFLNAISGMPFIPLTFFRNRNPLLQSSLLTTSSSFDLALIACIVFLR